MFETELFIKRFKMIEEVMSESKLIDLGKKAFLEEIKSDELGEMEKAQAAASFLSQIVTSALNIAAESALRVGISYEEEKAKKENTYHQSEMAREQINKLSLEKDLVKAQINLTNQQEDIEKAKLKSALADLEAKLKQLELLKVQILSEIEKIKTLNKTADDNLRVKVGELLIQFMQIALSKDWVKLDDKAGTSLYTHILNSIQDILAKSKNIALDTSKFDKIIAETLKANASLNTPSTNIKADNYNVLISNYTPNLDEIISIMVLSSDASITPKIYLDNKLIFSGFATSFKITSKKDYIVKVEFKKDIIKEYKLSVV
ncbi:MULTISPECIES: hypothetical protein [unclassified Campylobacter]|uniref:hypothetical protein n=1 Tax=unclassified Campylobacter TaxID=2593542 RepID=UPI001EFACBF5|nr:hypothetical protein [Campylobacter sp. RM12651]MBZ7976711.1 hypothetical protein [Campylobacter sp. RM12637]ULO02920.1 hypothetical protein AVBRAN_0450 [Campylobacter sp. RM12651]